MFFENKKDRDEKKLSDIPSSARHMSYIRCVNPMEDIRDCRLNVAAVAACRYILTE